MGKKKNAISKELKSWLKILIGSCIVVTGFVVFINPYHLVPGGVYGASIILHGLMPSIQVGTFGYMLQIPLLIFAVVLLGKSLGARTVFTVLITPAIMNVASWLAYPSQEALEALDPAQLLGGRINLSDHLAIAALFGGLLVGIGSGLIIKQRAGTGGTDIVAMILQKFLGVRFSKAILFVDGTIVFLGFAFSGDITLSLYSLIAIFVLSRAVAFGINGSKDDKIIYAICDDNMEKLRRLIVDEFELTSTVMPCQGMYSGQGKKMLMLVVHNKMVPRIVKRFSVEAPECFIIVADAYNAYGLRWKDFPRQSDLMLE